MNFGTKIDNMNLPELQIYTPSGEPRLPDGNCVIALGTFDGVHLAHRALLREAIALAHELGTRVGAFCFPESPASVMSGKEIPLLCTAERRIETMLSLGLDFVAVGDFHAYRTVTAEDFIESVIKKRLCAVGAVCGFNHRFGKGGLGSPELILSAFGEENVRVIPEVNCAWGRVSSSLIRAAIQEGDVFSASTLLHGGFYLDTPVVKGKQLGRKLGFPTANQLFPHGTVIPKHGIYAAVAVTEDGKRYAAVSNVGIRPTIVDGSDSHVANCETYIHSFSGDLYGKKLQVYPQKYLREEKKFSSVEELRDQISCDLDSALAYFDKENPLLCPARETELSL